MFSIPLIYKLGKLFFDRKVGLVSAFILSISPLHIWYSQEARGYALSIFLSMLMVYFFISIIKTNQLHLWICFIISSVIAVYANYFCFYLIIIFNALFFLRSYRHLLRRWLISLGFILIIFLPQSPYFVKKIIGIEKNFWILKPHLNALAITFENFNVGYNATPHIYFFTFIVFSLLFILGIKHWWPDKRNEVISLSSFLFIPIVLTYLISQKTSIYLDRQLMLFSPFYYIIIASGLAKIEARIIKIAVYLSVTLPILFCLNNYFSYRMPLPEYHHVGAHVKKPVKPAADYITNRFKEGDIMGYSDPSSINLFYYLWEEIPEERLDISAFIIKSKLGLYWSSCNGRYFLKSTKLRHVVLLDQEESCKRFQERSFKRLWLISSSWSRDGVLDMHSQAVREWLRAHYLTLDSREFDGIFVDLYGKRNFSIDSN